MQLVPVKGTPSAAHGAHGADVFDKHAGHNVAAFARKFWICLVLTIPIVAYSPLPQALLGWQAPVFIGSSFLPFVLGSIVFFYGGRVFLAGGWREIQARMPGMMTLISLAIIAAYGFSVYQTIVGGEETLFWELATLIVAMLLGHWLEMRAVQGAQGALRELSKLLPDTAEVVRGSATVTVPLAELTVGDVLMVRPGGKVPADGVVVEGRSNVDESLATGESKPVEKTVGAQVIAGTINTDGSLRVRVEKIGEETFLAGVKRLVQEAQASKSRLQLLSDRAAFYLTIIAVLSAVATVTAWLVVRNDVPFAIERMVAVLVIACPHALGLAVPLVAAISTSLAARHGFLVRQRLALEAARDVDIVLFDKTGTLTRGSYVVTDVWPVAAASEEQLIQTGAAVDAHSEHFISKAIVARARELKLELTPASDFRRLPGKGVEGRVEGTQVQVGGAALLAESGEQVPGTIAADVQAANGKGKTIIYVLRNGALFGVLALADAIREESRSAVEALKTAGITVGMMTGDSQAVARWVADDLGIDIVMAEVLPQDKANKVKELQTKGKRVMMVGDGINDAPALTQSDVGIAIGAGTTVAIESAGIILVRNDPRDIAAIVRLSRLTYRKMLQNLFWATGYNVVALPLAAGVAVSWGIVLNPALSALFMSFSTVIVAVNALQLRRESLAA